MEFRVLTLILQFEGAANYDHHTYCILDLASSLHDCDFRNTPVGRRPLYLGLY